MPFKSIITEPEQLATLSAAFDSAWLDLNRRSLIDELAASGARERLGYIIIGLWKADPAQDLARAAVEQFTSEPKDDSATPADLA